MLVTSISRPNSTLMIDTRPKLYVLEPPRRVAFCESTMQTNEEEIDDNPFRPGSELSREADIIVNLIKEGKPITPTREMVDNGLVPGSPQSLTVKNNTTNGHSLKISEQAKKNGAKPGVMEVKHSVVETQTSATGQAQQPINDVEMVVINKKKKKCCDIQ